MNINQEKLWSAYIDGQMSASEAADFDASLSPDDRERFSAEMCLEAAIVGALTNRVECPERVWKRIEDSICRSQKPRFRPQMLMGRPMFGIAAAAAILLGFFILHANRQSAPANMFTVPGSVEALVAEAEVTGDLEQVRHFLSQRNINVVLKPVAAMREPRGHKTVLLGARENRSAGDQTVELLYACCGEPVKVIIARAGSVAAQGIQQAQASDAVQASRDIGSYRIAVVSRHAAGQILDLLGESEPASPA